MNDELTTWIAIYHDLVTKGIKPRNVIKKLQELIDCEVEEIVLVARELT